jgi:hypothetical protein
MRVYQYFFGEFVCQCLTRIIIEQKLPKTPRTVVILKIKSWTLCNNAFYEWFK